MKKQIEKPLLQYGLILAVLYQLYQSVYDALSNVPVNSVLINMIIAIFLLLLLVLVRLEKSVNIVATLLHILILPALVYFWYYNGGIDGIVPFILCVYFGFIIATTDGVLKWICLGLYAVTLIVLLQFPDVIGSLNQNTLNLDAKPLDYLIVAIIITVFTIYLKNKYLFYRSQIVVRNDQLQRVAATLINQNNELEKQREEIKAINENLEELIIHHTKGIEAKNKELGEYAFINAHLLRGPLSRILGLAALMEGDPQYKKEDLTHIKNLANEMDTVVRKINDVLH